MCKKRKSSLSRKKCQVAGEISPAASQRSEDPLTQRPARPERRRKRPRISSAANPSRWFSRAPLQISRATSAEPRASREHRQTSISSNFSLSLSLFFRFSLFSRCLPSLFLFFNLFWKKFTRTVLLHRHDEKETRGGGD